MTTLHSAADAALHDDRLAARVPVAPRRTDWVGRRFSLPALLASATITVGLLGAVLLGITAEADGLVLAVASVAVVRA